MYLDMLCLSENIPVEDTVDIDDSDNSRWQTSTKLVFLAIQLDNLTYYIVLPKQDAKAHCVATNCVVHAL